MLSSSRTGREDYLHHAQAMIKAQLADNTELLFIPFAGVSIHWDQYTEKVQTALPQVKVTGIHQLPNAIQAIQNAKAIAVGGGNTFNLLHQLYKQDLISSLQKKITQGCPYIGWSAGSNICGDSIRTTNDMPIIQPPSFNALQFVPFQINPHYSDQHPENFNGETRAQRIQEFCALNPSMPVLGLREGSALHRQGNQLTLKGQLPGIIFLAEQHSIMLPGQDLSEYL
jgi:dipeptidase E